MANWTGQISVNIGETLGRAMSGAGRVNPFDAGLTAPAALGRGASEAARAKYKEEQAAYRTGMSRHGARMSALGGLASQAPGGAMMQGIGKAFASGGKIAGMAAGVTAIVGIAKQLLGMSKIFGTMSKTFFQMTSMMVDIAIMPMIPHMMKFLNWWIRVGTQKATQVGDWFARNGEQVANSIKLIGQTIGGIAKAIIMTAKAARWMVDPGGAFTSAIGMASGGIVTRPTNALIGEAGPEAVIPLGGLGASEGMTNQAGIFSKYQKKAGAYVDKINITVTRNMEQWFRDMFANSVVPETVSLVESVYSRMNTAAEENKNKTEEKSGGWKDTIVKFFSDFWGGMKIAWDKAKDWAKKVFGWLNPFGGDDEEPDVEGVDKDSGKSWFGDWKDKIGKALGVAKEWLAGKMCGILGAMPNWGGWKDHLGVAGLCDVKGGGEKEVTTQELKKEYLQKSGYSSKEAFYEDLDPMSSGIHRSHPDSDKSGSSVGALSALGDLYDHVKEAVTPVINKTKEVIKNEIIPAIIDPVSYFQDTMVDIYHSAPVTAAKEYVKEKVVEPISKGLTMGWEEVEELSGAVWNSKPAQDTKKFIEERVINPISAGWNEVEELSGAMWSSPVAKKAKKIFEPISSFASSSYNYGEDLYEDVAGGFSSAKSWVSDKASSIKTSVTESDIYKGGQSLLNKGMGLFGWRGQSGGIVPGPTGAPMMALLHGGETVLPTHLGQSWAQSTSGRTGVNGMAGGGMINAPTFNRPMTVQIYTTENAAGLLSRLDRMSNLEDAAFFTSV